MEMRCRRTKSRRASRTVTAGKRNAHGIRQILVFQILDIPESRGIRIADRGYVIVHGKIAFEGGSAEELNNSELVRKFYLGL
jgi:ABC-type lipopolysaccharide export system ATPase subunit